MEFDSKWVKGDRYALYDVLGFAAEDCSRHVQSVVRLVRRRHVRISSTRPTDPGTSIARPQDKETTDATTEVSQRKTGFVCA